MKYMRHIAKEVDDWIRLEAEFTGDYAHQLTDAIKQCDNDEEFKNVLVSSLIDRYMFFYVKSERPHKLTKLLLELLDSKNFQFESPSPRDNQLQQSIDHLIKGSGLYPTIWKVQQIWGRNAGHELLKYLFENYNKEFTPNYDHLSWINKYKQIYLTEGKPWSARKVMKNNDKKD